MKYSINIVDIKNKKGKKKPIMKHHEDKDRANQCFFEILFCLVSFCIY
jgi:hypothetical protein